MRQYSQHSTINTNGSLHTIRNITLSCLRIEILNLFTRKLLMIPKIEISPRMDTLQLLEPKWEIKLNISSCIGIMSQLLMIMETIILSPHSQILVPLQTLLLPSLEPLHLCTWLNEELHLHLLKLPHPEDELASHNLIPESLSYLSNSKRNLHTPSLLNIQILNEDTLSSFRTKINLIRILTSIANLSAEHQIKLTNISPILGPGNRVNYLTIKDNLLISIKIVCILSSQITLMNLINFCLLTKHIWISLTELGLIKRITKPLATFLNFLIHLLLKFGNIILNQHICTISFLRILIVNQRIIECSHMP